VFAFRKANKKETFPVENGNFLFSTADASFPEEKRQTHLGCILYVLPRFVKAKKDACEGAAVMPSPMSEQWNEGGIFLRLEEAKKAMVRDRMVQGERTAAEKVVRSLRSKTALYWHLT